MAIIHKFNIIMILKLCFLGVILFTGAQAFAITEREELDRSVHFPTYTAGTNTMYSPPKPTCYGWYKYWVVGRDDTTGDELYRYASSRRRLSAVPDSYCPGLHPPPPPPSGSCWVSASPSRTYGANGQNVTISWGSSGDVTRLSGNYSSGLSGSKVRRLKAANIGVTGYASDGSRLCSDSTYVSYTPPPTPPACRDGSDNDGDGLIDYPNDPGCTSSSDNNEYNAPVTCNISISPSSIAYGDDANIVWAASGAGAQSVRIANIAYSGLNDSVSIPMNQAGFWNVTLDVYSESNGNGSVVCSDSATVTVAQPVRECNDGIDNDGDGEIDYSVSVGMGDPGCSSNSDDDETDPPPAQPPAPTPSVSVIDSVIIIGASTVLSWNPNGHSGTCTINAGDGTANSASSTSISPNATTTYTIECEDTGNNYSGANITSDSTDLAVTPIPPTQCNDGINNSDGDNWIDYPDDPGCTDANDNDESNTVTQCNDGYNNDGPEDSLIDFVGGDLGCSSPSDNDETNPQCSDGVDNVDPEDTLFDYQGGAGDPGCSSDLDDDETDPLLGGLGAEEPTITASAAIVRKGEPVNIEWNSYGYVGDCELSPDVKFSTSNPTASGNEDIVQNARTTYTYTCENAAVGHSISTSTEVQVLPTLFES